MTDNNKPTHICFWCGEQIDDSNPRAQNTNIPQNILQNYTPCQNCQDYMMQGITLVEVCDHKVHNNLPPIQNNDYPTGNWCVLKPEAITRLFNDDASDQLLKYKTGFLNIDMYRTLITVRDEDYC